MQVVLLDQELDGGSLLRFEPRRPQKARFEGKVDTPLV
jgi:hypothetical protein